MFRGRRSDERRMMRITMLRAFVGAAGLLLFAQPLAAAQKDTRDTINSIGRKKPATASKTPPRRSTARSRTRSVLKKVTGGKNVLAVKHAPVTPPSAIAAQIA